MSKQERHEGTFAKALEHVPVCGHICAIWHWSTNDDASVGWQAFNRANNGSAALGVTAGAIACAPAAAGVATLAGLGAAGGAVGTLIGIEVQAGSELVENMCGLDVKQEACEKFENPGQLAVECAIGGVTGAITGGLAGPASVATKPVGAKMMQDGTVQVTKGLSARLPAQTLLQAQVDLGQQALTKTAADAVANSGYKAVLQEAQSFSQGATTSLVNGGFCAECSGMAILTCSGCKKNFCDKHRSICKCRD